LLLFSVHAVRYAGLAVFQLKMLLLLGAALNALLLSRVPGWSDRNSANGARRIQFAAGLSIALWLGAILCGRVIAYVD
jgi:hypothetical protein